MSRQLQMLANMPLILEDVGAAVAAVQTEDPDILEAASRGLKAGIMSPDPDIRMAAGEALRTIAPDGTAVVPLPLYGFEP